MRLWTRPAFSAGALSRVLVQRFLAGLAEQQVPGPQPGPYYPHDPQRWAVGSRESWKALRAEIHGNVPLFKLCFSHVFGKEDAEPQSRLPFEQPSNPSELLLLNPPVTFMLSAMVTFQFSSILKYSLPQDCTKAHFPHLCHPQSRQAVFLVSFAGSSSVLSHLPFYIDT